jgi:nitrate reductase beta subunit
VGRIRYMGVLLYDADKIAEAGTRPDGELVDAHRDMICDPFDPLIIAAAKANGIGDDVIKSAQQSPVYKFVKDWGLALAPHPEYRTFPMLFYVPALAPVTATLQDGLLSNDSDNLFHALDEARTPMAYLASLFAAGHEGPVRFAMKKQMAVRLWRRALTVGDIDVDTAKRALAEADCTPEEAEEIYKMTSLPTFEERFVIPPSHREQAIEVLKNPLENKGLAGIGFREAPERGL